MNSMVELGQDMLMAIGVPPWAILACVRNQVSMVVVGLLGETSKYNSRGPQCAAACRHQLLLGG